MLATQTTFAREVATLAELEKATIDLDNVVRHFDRIMSLLRRKCKGRCSLKRCLEEYCAFRLAALYLEKNFEISFDDEVKLRGELQHVIDTFEGEEFEATERKSAHADKTSGRLSEVGENE